MGRTDASLWGSDQTGYIPSCFRLERSLEAFVYSAFARMPKPAKAEQSEKYLAWELVHGTGNPHPLLGGVNPMPQSAERPMLKKWKWREM